MKKIKDWGKVIGVIGRGGTFFPSNERSNEKALAVYSQHLVDPIHKPLFWDRQTLEHFRTAAKACGYSVMVIQRGLNR